MSQKIDFFEARDIDTPIQPRKKKQCSKKHDVGVALLIHDDGDMKNLIAMDLPGCFPTTSTSGN